MIEILTNLAKLSPIIAVLVVGIIYLYKREKEARSEVSKLNDELRENEKENLNMLNKLVNAMDKISITNQSTTQAIKDEIKSLKDYIQIKMELMNGR